MESDLERVAAAARDFKRASRNLDAVRGELHAAIRQAYAGHESVRVIAKVAGLSRARVHQIVRDR